MKVSVNMYVHVVCRVVDHLLASSIITSEILHFFNYKMIFFFFLIANKITLKMPYVGFDTACNLQSN